MEERVDGSFEEFSAFAGGDGEGDAGFGVRVVDALGDLLDEVGAVGASLFADLFEGEPAVGQDAVALVVGEVR